MKIFGRGKNTDVTASDDELDIAVDDDGAFDEAGDGSLSAPQRGLGAPGGGNKKMAALLLVVLLLGGGFAAMMMMGGDDTPARPIAVDAMAPTPAMPMDPNAPVDPNAQAGMMPADPNAPVDPLAAATAPVDPMANPMADPMAAGDSGMPPMPEMPPMPGTVTDTATAPVDPNAPIDPLAAVPAPLDPNMPVDPNAPVTAPAAAVDPLAPVAPPADGAADMADAESEMPGDSLLDAPAVPGSAVPGAPMPPIATTADPAAPIISDAATATPPVMPAATPAAPAATPNTAEQALMDNAALVEAEAQVQPMAQTPETIAQLWAQLPVEDAMVRPLPQQYLTVKKEKSAESIDSRLATARRALNDGRVPAALQFFNDLRNDFPNDTRVLMGRAVALQRLGQNEQALQGYEDVLINDPKNLDALTNMLGLIKQQNPQLALEKLQDLRNLYPYNADITTQLAVAYGQNGNLNEALRYITLAEALKPDSGYVLYNKAVLYDRMGRTTEAADMYRQLIRRAADGTLDQNLPIESLKKRLAVMR